MTDCPLPALTRNPPEISNNPMKKLAILGSTGSIGQSTLSIVEQFPDRYSVVSLAAGRNLDQAFAQTLRWRPKLVSLATEELAAALSAKLKQAGVTGIEVVHGTQGTVACSTLPEADAPDVVPEFAGLGLHNCTSPSASDLLRAYQLDESTP